MNVVYALTRNIYERLLPAIRSLYEHHPDAKVYIICEDDIFPLEIPFDAKVINVSNQQYFTDDCPNKDTVFTYMAMIRVCYTKLLPRVKKVLQLDVDTIVCDSLEPLWQTDISGKWIAACPEYFGNHNPFHKEKYYNVGVCLFNLAQMRKEYATEQMVNILNSMRLKYVEQDVINYLAVPERCVDIPVRYNESFCCGYTDDPAIVHYAGRMNYWTDPGLYRREYLERYM